MISMVMSALALIFSAITVGFSFAAYARVVGLENSTHQVQMVPMDFSNPSPTGDEMIRDMGKAFGIEDAEDYKSDFEKFDPNDIEQ